MFVKRSPDQMHAESGGKTRESADGQMDRLASRVIASGLLVSPYPAASQH